MSETKTPCYAWALIPNHFYILARTGSASLSTVMRRLLTGYAVSFNRRHRRSGHLFENRYKSILCQENPYLLELVRYIQRLGGSQKRSEAGAKSRWPISGSWATVILSKRLYRI